MPLDISTINPDRIQFVYQWIAETEEIGQLTFFNEGRFPGSFSLGGQLLHWNQAFDHAFSGGLVVRSPGVVAKQTIQVELYGGKTDYVWDHTKELARSLYGDRPIIEVISCLGEVTLLSYRPKSMFESSWCRVVPTLLDSPKPYGMLSRHLERVAQVYSALVDNCFALLLTVLAVAAGLGVVSALIGR